MPSEEQLKQQIADKREELGENVRSLETRMKGTAARTGVVLAVAFGVGLVISLVRGRPRRS